MPCERSKENNASLIEIVSPLLGITPAYDPRNNNEDERDKESADVKGASEGAEPAVILDLGFTNEG